jgi:hypothetical protein
MINEIEVLICWWTFLSFRFRGLEWVSATTIQFNYQLSRLRFQTWMINISWYDPIWSMGWFFNAKFKAFPSVNNNYKSFNLGMYKLQFIFHTIHLYITCNVEEVSLNTPAKKKQIIALKFTVILHCIILWLHIIKCLHMSHLAFICRALQVILLV